MQNKQKTYIASSEHCHALGICSYGDWSGLESFFETEMLYFIEKIIKRSMECVLLVGMENGMVKQRKYTEKNIKELSKKLTKQEIAEISCSAKMQAYPDAFNIAELHIKLGLDVLNNRFDSQVPNEMTLYFYHLTQSGLYTEDEFIQILKRWGITTNAVNGFATRGFQPMDNTLSEYSARRRNIEPETCYREKLKGYFWANYLTAGHILKLGGIDAIREEAPCCQVEAVQDNAVLLRATNTFDEFTLEKRLEIKEYLRPVNFPEDWLTFSESPYLYQQQGIVLTPREKEIVQKYRALSKSEKGELIQQRVEENDLWYRKLTDSIIKKDVSKPIEKERKKESQEIHFIELTVSKSFIPEEAVLVMDFFEISFSEKKKLQDVINAWGLICELRGFGRGGMHYIGPIGWERGRGELILDITPSSDEELIRSINVLEKIVNQFCMDNALVLNQFILYSQDDYLEEDQH